MNKSENVICSMIIDDDVIAAERLEHLLSKSGIIQNKAIINSPLDAMQQMRKHQPDVVFMDIEMPYKSGFELINDFRKAHLFPEVIIVTNFKQYAIKALKFEVFDFLLKPIDFDELKNTLSRFHLKKLSDKKNVPEPMLAAVPESEMNVWQKKQVFKQKTSISTQKISLTTKTGFVFLEPSEILFFEADGTNTIVHLTNQPNIIAKNYLTIVENSIPTAVFIRISRFHLINLQHLKKIDQRQKMVVLITDSDEVSLPVSRKYFKRVMQI